MSARIYLRRFGKYQNMLRKLTVEEYNEKAKYMDCKKI